MASTLPAERLNGEWLEADGLGGFASGTVGGIRTRRYHALLLAATTPPTGRMVLVNGLEVVARDAGRALRAQQPSATRRTWSIPTASGGIVDFRTEPWPTWTFRAEDGTEVSQEVVACHGRGDVVVRWRLLLAARPGAPDGAPAALGPRLPRAAPREPGLRLRRRGHRRARAVAALSGRAGDLGGRPTAATGTTRSGTATSSTTPSARAASTSPRTSPRPACSRWTLNGRDATLMLRRRRGLARASTPAWLLDARGAAPARLRARRSSARPTPTSCAAAPARRSSPATPGSPTGAATPSSRCAAS